MGPAQGDGGRTDIRLVDPVGAEGIAFRDTTFLDTTILDTTILDQATLLDRERVFIDLRGLLDASDQLRFVRNRVELEDVGRRGGAELAVGDFLWVEEGSGPKELLPKGQPQRLYRGLVNLGQDADSRQLDLRLLDVMVIFAETPLVWKEEVQAYATEVLLYLKVAGGSKRARALPEAVEVTFATEGATAGVRPRRISLKRIGDVNPRKVLFTVQRHGEPTALRTILGGGSSLHPAQVQAKTAVLELVPSVQEVLGFGLGTVDLSLYRLAEDGEPHESDSSVDVSLTTSRGVLDAPSLSFQAGTSRVDGVRLRSRGVGVARVEASLGGLASPTITVRFVWPIAVLVAGLLGGALGAWVKLTGVQPTERRPRRKTTALLGAAVGLAAVLGVLTGIAPLLPTPPGSVGSVGGAFLLALLAGYAGRKSLESMAPFGK